MADAPLTYDAAGVSIDAQDEAIARFKDAVTKTHGPEVLAGVGAFGAAFAPRLDGIERPVFVSSTDSLGTKTILHSRFGTWQAAGRDVVGCVVNDIIVSGARPLFFLDYLAINKVVPDEVEQIVGGVAAACGEISCALIGGEVAEMNDVYKPGDFDLVGFALGLVDRSAMLDSARMAAGDAVIGLASNGVHCNGFSLVRKALADLSADEWLADNPELGGNLRDALLKPTRCYANEMADLNNKFRLAGAAHISGGGLIDNVPRVVPEHLSVVIDRNKVPVPPVFDFIQRQGRIADDEMWHVFNMGIGFTIVVKPDDVPAILDYCSEQEYGALLIGEIAAATQPRFTWRN
ncbi:phosphoribosylformylglycinamidine cyclo-ligase [bacterium]|nr:phosphoribosylformylglycinamidine cyclo-ligase [bacterium]